MATLTVDLFTTVDGFAAGRRSPAYFGYGGPELERWIDDELRRPQTVLLGRVTYETLSAIEPGGRLAALSKVVVSTTLDAPDWPNTRVARSLDEVRALKEAGPDPLRTMGSLTLVRALVEAGLVDRLRLMVFPLVLGDSGAEPVLDGLDVHLELLETSLLDGRLVLAEYRPLPVGRKGT